MFYSSDHHSVESALKPDEEAKMYGAVSQSSSPRGGDDVVPKLRIVTPTDADEHGVVFENRSPLGSPVGVEADDAMARKGSMRVFIPVVSSIFGVIIFMRLGMIVGTIGVFRAWSVIGVAFAITLLSVGSMSALASSRTNTSTESFEFYEAMIEAMGKTAGGAMRILLFLSFSVVSAYYVLGFSEITMFYLGVQDKVVPLPWNSNGSWITVSIASSTQSFLLVGLYSGGKIGKRLLKLVFVVVMTAVVSNILFLVVPNTSTGTGISSRFFSQNIVGHAPHELFKIFGEFFPAFCGALAGIHVANSLGAASSGMASARWRQRESTYLVTGTHQALGFCCVVYIVLSAVLAATVENEFLRDQQLVVQVVVDSILGVPVIYLGIAATTLTSALSNVVAAASISKLARATASEHSSSWQAIALTWAVSQTAILRGSVDSIIPMVSSSFLLLFAAVNFGCFYLEVSTPSFRPTFILYNQWSALLGFCLSVGALFVVVSSFVVGIMIVGTIGGLVYQQSDLGSDQSTSSTTSKSPGRHGTETRIRDFTGDAWVERVHEDTIKDSSKDEDYTSRVELAALYVRDAVHGRFLGEDYVTGGKHKLEIKRWYHALHYFRLGNMAILLALSFVEVPAWCYFKSSCGESSRTLMWSSPLLSREVTTVIELLNLAVLMMEALLKYNYLGQQLYFANKWHIVHLILLFSDAVSVLLVVFVPRSDVDAKNQLKPAVLSPAIRPLLLLTMSERLRSGFVSLLRVLPRVIDGLLTLLVLIAIYSICGMVMFEGTNEGRQYFPNFETASMNMLVLLTTANFPDVMMPSYAKARYTSVFFVSFLIIGLLLVMNLVFASMYQNYRQEVTQRAIRYASSRNQSLEFAFRLLPGHNRHKNAESESEKVISRSTLEDVMSALLRPVIPLFDTNRHPSHQETPLDASYRPQDEINFTQFTAKIRGFAARQKSVSRNSARFVSRELRASGLARVVQDGVRAKWFEYVVDVIIFVNLVAIQRETQAKIDADDHTYMLLERVMPFFSCAYLVEMALKMFAFGLRDYFARTKNRYDCIVTLVIVVAEVSVHVHYTEGMDWQWIRMLLFLRFLRCLRLLVALQGLSTMFSIVVRLLPAFTTLYGMLGIVMMEYAAIGVIYFGGNLVVGDPRLAAITYGKSNYYANNFNDFPSALTTLFELLLVNNWNVIMEGTEAVSSKWSRLYFVSYYIIAVVMMLNLVVAFVVEAYFEQQSGAQEDCSSPGPRLQRASLTSMPPFGSAASLKRSTYEGVQADQGRHELRKRPPVIMRPRGDSVYVEEFL